MIWAEAVGSLTGQEFSLRIGQEIGQVMLGGAALNVTDFCWAVPILLLLKLEKLAAIAEADRFWKFVGWIEALLHHLRQK